MDRRIIWPNDIKDMHKHIGDKAFGLAKLSKEQIHVAPFFIVTEHAFEDLIEPAELMPRLRNLVTSIHDESSLIRNSSTLQNLIAQLPLPDDLYEELIESYEVLEIDFNKTKISDMVNQLSDPVVAVRVSASDKGLSALMSKKISGQLIIKGASDLIKAITGVWIAQFLPDILEYKRSTGLDPLTPLSIVIQQVVKSTRACKAVADEKSISIESIPGASWGLREGRIASDKYVFNTELEMKESQPSKHTAKFLFDEESLSFIKQEGGSFNALSDREAYEAARITKKASQAFDSPVSLVFDLYQEQLIVTGCTLLEDTQTQIPLEAFKKPELIPELDKETETSEELQEKTYDSDNQIDEIDSPEHMEIPDYIEIPAEPSTNPSTDQESLDNPLEFIELPLAEDHESDKPKEDSIFSDYQPETHADLSKCILIFKHTLISALKEKTGINSNILEDLTHNLNPELVTSINAVDRLLKRFLEGETLSVSEIEFALKIVRQVIEL